MATHKLPAEMVVQMLKDNGINKVKLFDADEDIMTALMGTSIEVMVGIPNNMLSVMNNYDEAEKWVDLNVASYIFEGGVKIKYIAVGNEPFLQAYNGTLLNITFPALQNIQNALNDYSLGDKIKATIPLNADVYNSPPSNPVPSSGTFRADISDLMTQLVHFLDKNNAPFTVNIYPFLSLYLNPDFPIDYAFFDGNAPPVQDNLIQYTNVFDANFDTLVSSLNAVGVGNLSIIVGEVGWPTDGDKNAKTTLAERFYTPFLKRVASKQGTPLRPNTEIEVYLFSLLDEDAKDVAPGYFERHWGIFGYDGQPKFRMDLSGQGKEKMPVGANDVTYLSERWCMLNPNSTCDLSKVGDNINYACSYSDCTSLSYGSSCNGLDANGKASYAFNMYFQTRNQEEGSCVFEGLGMITTQNYSNDQCRFIVQIESSASTLLFSLFWVILLVYGFLMF